MVDFKKLTLKGRIEKALWMRIKVNTGAWSEWRQLTPAMKARCMAILDGDVEGWLAEVIETTPQGAKLSVLRPPEPSAGEDPDIPVAVDHEYEFKTR
jgi:hypothetical protein